MNLKRTLLIALFLLNVFLSKAQMKSGESYQEPYRPQLHFSPEEKWMNDPNGMVYYKGMYHLFFQYYPNDIVWGPMHWGHAVSRDLVHWKQLPIALYPDSLGYIFSGSAVIDYKNTSGFGKKGQAPMVAIFTQHDPKLERTGSDKFQNESIAYSLDGGNTWIKYTANPVLKNPGIRDFRDPKVSWYAPGKKWIMTLATKDRVTFYSSRNLKDWSKESEFGQGLGEHGGVWECPDLFPLKLKSKKYWVLLVSENPGGPNGGSATQYFIGNFDGKTFIPLDNKSKWIDYGPDDYAGVTWGNTGERKIFLGWMSNWLYADQAPTQKWRGAMTIPRELALRKVNGDIVLTSNPVNEIKNLATTDRLVNVKNLSLPLAGKLPDQYMLALNAGNIMDYSLVFSNSSGEQLVIGYRKNDNSYFIDRSHAGEVNFNGGFVKLLTAPRLSKSRESGIKLLVDASSVELFADNGSTNMTAVFFPKSNFDHLQVKKQNGMIIKNLWIIPLKSIWKGN
ncbi:MAG: glycoside hydrolase family 32 protein [Sphingobacteriales bacterium]